MRTPRYTKGVEEWFPMLTAIATSIFLTCVSHANRPKNPAIFIARPEVPFTWQLEVNDHANLMTDTKDIGTQVSGEHTLVRQPQVEDGCYDHYVYQSSSEKPTYRRHRPLHRHVKVCDKFTDVPLYMDLDDKDWLRKVFHAHRIVVWWYEVYQHGNDAASAALAEAWSRYGAMTGDTSPVQPYLQQCREVTTVEQKYRNQVGASLVNGAGAAAVGMKQFIVALNFSEHLITANKGPCSEMVEDFEGGRIVPDVACRCEINGSIAHIVDYENYQLCLNGTPDECAAHARTSEVLCKDSIPCDDASLQ